LYWLWILENSVRDWCFSLSAAIFSTSSGENDELSGANRDPWESDRETTEAPSSIALIAAY
jgi:hypothetical protein